MNLYIYSDESGVFDKNHEKFFVFAGIVFLDKNSKDKMQNKYFLLEKQLKKELNFDENSEFKACLIKNKTKQRIYKYFKKTHKFAIVIDMEKIQDYKGKQNKQRYLDYAFKIGLKKYILHLDNENILNKNEIKNIYLFPDQHSISTNGRYDLQNGILNEFKYGSINFEKNTQFPPIIPNLERVILQYHNSKHSPLVRGADIISNKIRSHYIENKQKELLNTIFITNLP